MCTRGDVHAPKQAELSRGWG